MQALNEQFDGSLRILLCRPQRPHVDEATLISIDKLGADVRVRVGSDYSVERIGWQNVSPSSNQYPTLVTFFAVPCFCISTRQIGDSIILHKVPSSTNIHAVH